MRRRHNPEGFWFIAVIHSGASPQAAATSALSKCLEIPSGAIRAPSSGWNETAELATLAVVEVGAHQADLAVGVVS